MMPLIRDKDNVLYAKNYDCDICHEADSLRLSAYTITIDGKSKAVCGGCFRQNNTNTKDRDSYTE